MKVTFSKQWFRWLTPIWLLSVLVLAGCSGGSLSSGKSTTTPTDPVVPPPSEAKPAKPSVENVEVKLTEEIVIIGGCTKNEGAATQTDIIEVTVGDSANIRRTTCDGVDPNAKWIVSFPANTFSVNTETISVKAKTHSGIESEIAYGTLKVTDGDKPQPGPLDLLPADPAINRISILSTDNAIISGTCLHASTDANSGTDYVTVSVEGKSSLKALCLDDNTWSRDFGKFTPNIYLISAKATKQAVGDSNSTANFLNVESAFVSVVATPMSGELKSGESVSLTITFKDQLNKVLSGVASIRFRSDCLQSNQAVMLENKKEQTVFETENGTVIAEYKTDGCRGLDEIFVTGTYEGSAVSSSESVKITTAEDVLTQIKWISSIPEQIVTRGSNGEQVAEITFELSGVRGAKMPGKEISFSVNAAESEHDIKLLNTSATSNDQGLVVVRVQSGYKNKNVTIDATYIVDENDPSKNVLGQSEQLNVANGMTTHGNVTLNLKRYSPLSYQRDSTMVDNLEVIATVKDRLGGPVADGTVVTFQVESTTSSNPGIGSIGSFFNAEGDKATKCETISGVCSTFWGPDGQNHATDGYVTIMAIAKGQENFNDKNNNHYFDDGDELYDEAEPYLDHKSYYEFVKNDKGVSSETLISSDYIEGDYAIRDINDNGIRDLKNGKFDGVNCNHSGKEEKCGKNTLIDITAQVTFNQASNGISICQDFDQAGFMQVEANGKLNLSGLRFCDSITGQLIPTGSKIEFTPDEGEIVGEKSFVIPGQRKLPYDRSFTFTAGTTFNVIGSITAKVTVPKADSANGGDLSATFSWLVEVIKPTDGWLPSTPQFSFGNNLHVRKLDAMNIGGSCNESSSYGNVSIPTDKIRLIIAGKSGDTLNCVNGAWSFSGSLSNIPGEVTLSIASVAEPSDDLPETFRTYYSKPRTAKLYVANTPDPATTDIGPYQVENGKVVIKGECTAGNTTDVKVSISTSPEPTVATVACNVGAWELPVTLSAGTYTVNTLAINLKERITFSNDESFYTTNSASPTDISVN